MIVDPHSDDSFPVRDQRGTQPPASFSLRRVITMTTGALGVLASLAALYGVAKGYFEPGPSLDDLAEQTARIERSLARPEDQQVLNQVSRRVTELGDQYGRIEQRLRDIQALDRSLAEGPPAGKILTAGQRATLAASQQAEREQLVSLLAEAESLALTFITVSEADDALRLVGPDDQLAAQAKQRVLTQVARLREQALPELARLRAKHAP